MFSVCTVVLILCESCASSYESYKRNVEWVESDDDVGGQRLFELELKHKDLYQIRICRTSVFLQQQERISMLEPRLFTQCPCDSDDSDKQNTRTNQFPKNQRYKAAHVESQNDVAALVGKDSMNRAAVSVINYYLDGIGCGSKCGKGVLLRPRRPIYFKAKNGSYYDRESAKYIGRDPWFNLFHPVPMNVAFGYTHFDLNQLEEPAPLFWKIEDDTVLKVLVYQGDVRILVDIDLKQPTIGYDEIRKHLKDRHLLDEMIRNKEVFELRIKLDKNNGTCSLGYITHVSHSFTETASPKSSENLLPVAQAVYLAEYPEERPYSVNPDSLESNDGISLSRQKNYQVQFNRYARNALNKPHPKWKKRTGKSIQRIVIGGKNDSYKVWIVESDRE